MSDSKLAADEPRFTPLGHTGLAAAVAIFTSAIAVWWVYSHRWVLYWGDAEAHLNIARRIIESRTPGYEQLGSPWLPLPHLLMLPFVWNDWLWRTGLAGSVPNAACFAIAAILFFASVRRIFSTAAAWCAMALFVLNPNALYVQSIPMTEAVFFATLMGVLFFTLRYSDTNNWRDLLGAALFCIAASLTRYEGWFLIPFATSYVWFTSRKHRIPRALVFGALASIGALFWFGYNWWLTGNALDFYNGPHSAEAIQKSIPYEGFRNWRMAAHYFLATARLVTGWPLLWIGGIGLVAVCFRRAFWPLALLILPPAFYVWSVHSSWVPIRIPQLPPHGYYNTRYALSMLPLMAFGVAALVPHRHTVGRSMAAALALLCAGFWLFHLSPEDCITWKESQVNSDSRRAWTRASADYLQAHAVRGDTYFTTFGDISGIFREAGIPFRRTVTWDEFLEWQSAVNRPDLFLWEAWAVAQKDDLVDQTVSRARKLGIVYDLATEITVAGAPPIEIYHRHEYPLR